jgi:acetolactate synthase-1/2/3 large subunit
MVRWKQAVDGFPDYGMTFNNPDFVQYAITHGAKDRRVTDADSLVSTLNSAFAEGGVSWFACQLPIGAVVGILIYWICARDNEVLCRPNNPYPMLCCEFNRL